MKKFHFIILCFFCAFVCKAQDTIFFKTTEKLVVLVKEVSQTEIQYKKVELPDGPMYIASKNDIAKIVYKNGYTETIVTAAVAAPIVTQQAQDFTVLHEGAPTVNNEKITYQDSKKRYYYLSNLANTHPDINKRPLLLKSVKSIRNLKAGQDVTRTVGIVFGALTIATGAIYGVINRINTNNGINSGSEFVKVPVASGSLALVMVASSVVFHVSLKKKRHDFVKAYNE